MARHDGDHLAHPGGEEEMAVLLSEPFDLTEAQHVLGVGCRAGGWLLSLAKKYPHVQFIAIDENEELVDAACTQAARDHVQNAAFLVRDLRHLNESSFFHTTFDVIYATFLAEHLLTIDYAALASSLFTLCRSGGRLCWLEGELPITNSAAFEALTARLCQALQAKGQSFISADLQEIATIFAQWLRDEGHNVASVERRTLGMTPLLGYWLRKAGFQSISHTPYAIEVSTGTNPDAAFLRQVSVLMYCVKPLLLNTGVMNESAFDDLCSQVQTELQGETFCGIWWLLQVCGRKP